jgi:hypothetical protein
LQGEKRNRKWIAFIMTNDHLDWLIPNCTCFPRSNQF